MDKEKCKDCANKKTLYCEICINNDLYMDKKEKANNDFMCDLMCGNNNK